jgi:hypothetical protein
MAAKMEQDRAFEGALPIEHRSQATAQHIGLYQKVCQLVAFPRKGFPIVIHNQIAKEELLRDHFLVAGEGQHQQPSEFSTPVSL